MSKPKVLWLSPCPIVPPAGGSLRTFFLIKHLARTCDISVVSPNFEGYQAAGAIRRLRELEGVRVMWAGRHESKGSGAFFGGLYHRLAEKHYWRLHPLGQNHSPLHRWHGFLKDFIVQEKPDCVVLDHVLNVGSLKYLRGRFPGIPSILNTHNVESLNLKRYMRLHASGLKHRLLVKSQYKVILAREANLAACADLVWTCSEKDSRVLRLLDRGGRLRSHVVPNGIELPDISAQKDGCRGDSKELLFVGMLHYPLVRDGISWFCKRVWPLVKKTDNRVRLTIVGYNPGKSMKSVFGDDERIRVEESVSSVLPYYARASVSVCPIQSGSGTRIKILEAMGAGVPVVSTKVGWEGIDAVPGKHLLSADAPAEFAVAIRRLLEDDCLYEQMRRNARRLAEERYDWKKIAEGAGDLIRELAGSA